MRNLRPKFRRKSRWMRPPFVDTLKRLVREVRLEKKSLQKLALATIFRDAKGQPIKIPERTLRRYVDVSKDDERQESGLYIPLQSYETLPKQLQRKKTRREKEQKLMEEQMQKPTHQKKKQTQKLKDDKQKQQIQLQTHKKQKPQLKKQEGMEHHTKEDQTKKQRKRSRDSKQTDNLPAKHARMSRHPQPEVAAEMPLMSSLSHLLPNFSPPLSTGSLKLPISTNSPWTQLTPSSLKTPLSELRTFDEAYAAGLPQPPFLERRYSCSSLPASAGAETTPSTNISVPSGINSPIDLPVTPRVPWDTDGWSESIDADGSFCT